VRRDYSAGGPLGTHDLPRLAPHHHPVQLL